jgi:hypothetical protein
MAYVTSAKATFGFNRGFLFSNLLTVWRSPFWWLIRKIESRLPIEEHESSSEKNSMISKDRNEERYLNAHTRDCRRGAARRNTAAAVR